MALNGLWGIAHRTGVPRCLLFLTTCYLALIVQASAQEVSVGFKVGHRSGVAYVETGGDMGLEPSRVRLGPSFEISLPRDLAIEGSAIHQSLDSSRDASRLGPLPGGHPSPLEPRPAPRVLVRRFEIAGRTWEIPIVVKKYLRLPGPASAFAAAGWVIRSTDGSARLIGEGTFGDPPDEFVREWDTGVTIGAGATVAFGPLRLQPEVRFTRWSDRVFGRWIQTSRYGVDVLFGIGFGR